LKIGSLESEKIGSLQVHTRYLTFSFKKTCFIVTLELPVKRSLHKTGAVGRI